MSANAYGDPRALRSAISDRLRPVAREREVPLANLLRQFAYERLLCRVFALEPDRWVLKGATAMLARLGPQARHTRDVDLLSLAGDVRDAERALGDVSGVDLGDFFAFVLQPGRSLIEGVSALRVPVQAYLGPRRFASFHVDLVAGRQMTGTPDSAAGLLPVELPGLERCDYLLYPVVDHIADKVCALHETHGRASGRVEGSSRYRDLADLAAFAHACEVVASELATALEAGSTRRSVALPTHVEVPQDGDWARGYERAVQSTRRLPERDLRAALTTVGRFIDPVLDGHAYGSWNRTLLVWT